MTRRLFLLGLSLVLLGACDKPSAGVSTNATSGTDPSNATVIRVIDGDTIEADFAGTRERIRLIGVDTPETKKPNTPIQCFGPEASEFTKGVLAQGTRILVRRDVEARDDYGRLLGYVYRSNDDMFVNLELVEQGFAKPLTIKPNDTFAVDFVNAARRAQAAHLGLWAACSG